MEKNILHAYKYRMRYFHLVAFSVNYIPFTKLIKSWAFIYCHELSVWNLWENGNRDM